MKQKVVSVAAKARSITSSASRRGAAGSISGAEWAEVCRRHQYRCAVCREARQLTADHVVPISKGGTTSAGNIRPLCAECNGDKSDSGIGDVDAWRAMPIADVDRLREMAIDRIRAMESMVGGMSGDRRRRMVGDIQAAHKELREIGKYLSEARSGEVLRGAREITMNLLAQRTVMEMSEMSDRELARWISQCRELADRIKGLDMSGLSKHTTGR